MKEFDLLHSIRTHRFKQAKIDD